MGLELVGSVMDEQGRAFWATKSSGDKEAFLREWAEEVEEPELSPGQTIGDILQAPFDQLPPYIKNLVVTCACSKGVSVKLGSNRLAFFCGLC